MTFLPVPRQLQAEISWLSTWVHIDSGVCVLVTGFLTISVNNTETLGVLLESGGERIGVPVDDFRRLFKKKD